MINIHYTNGDIGLDLEQISMYFFDKKVNEETKNLLIKKLTGCSDISKNYNTLD